MSTTPAGWYDDGTGVQRWWDGNVWTEHVASPTATEVTHAAGHDVVVITPSSDAATASEADQPNRREKATTMFVNARDKVAGALNDSYDPALLPDTLWAATAKTLTGLTGGRYRLTTDFLFYEKGTFSTNAQQIRTHLVYDVDAVQSLTQKARNVGNIVLSVQADTEKSGQAYIYGGKREKVVLEDVPDFRTGARAINDVAFQQRERLRLRGIDEQMQLRHNHQSINYTGLASAVASPFPIGTVPAAVAAAPTNSAGSDLNAELERLVAFRDSGALDADEFIAAKRKLLGI
jgi:hypothetical protein